LREWDAVVSVDAPALTGDEAEVVVLGDDEHPFARALKASLEPPYRAVGIRRGDRWNVGAKQIRVAELAGVEGDELSLTVRDEERMLEVDGRPTLFGLEAVERVAGGRFESYVLRARRLQGDTWEVDLAAL
jgi:hypothetical protein